MAKRLKMVEMNIDLDEIAEFIGEGQALANIEFDHQYIEDITRFAYKEAEDEFNSAAAAAGASGSIKHMFEWGTVGINRGRSDMRPNPLSETARLWKTTMVGFGLNHTMTFMFKPSIATVPKPTVAKSGMDPAIIETLSDHVFQWKARVLESGEMVTILPKNTKFLLIPYYDGASDWFSNYDIQRGYKLSKGPHTHSPGETGGTMGNFTSFWYGFWEGRGSEIIDNRVDSQLEMDFVNELRTQPRRGRLQASGSFKKAVLAERNRVQRKARNAARQRNRGL